MEPGPVHGIEYEDFIYLAPGISYNQMIWFRDLWRGVHHPCGKYAQTPAWCLHRLCLLLYTTSLYLYQSDLCSCSRFSFLAC